MILIDGTHPENVDENEMISDQLSDESCPSS
jgi:hypothetical protein